jgi:hypothetical protein
MSADEHLLHHIGRVELAAHPGIEVDAGQYLQVGTEWLQGLRRVRGHISIVEDDVCQATNHGRGIMPNGADRLDRPVVGPAMTQPHEGNEQQTQPGEPSSLAVEGEKAFARDLSGLLKERPGQWVAYHGNRQLGFARTSTELYEKGLAQGIPEDDLSVLRIEAETPQEKVPPFAVDVALSHHYLEQLRSRTD